MLGPSVPQASSTVNDRSTPEYLLTAAMGPDAYNAVLDQMNEEIKIAHAARLKAKKEMEDIRKGRPGATRTNHPARQSRS